MAELGSVSAAAARLHRTPSAVSMTVTNLEAQLGRDLFEPGGKTRLTPFGAYVFEAAREQISQFDRSLESIRAYARNDIGRVDIAVVPSFATRHLPALLGKYIERYPRVTLSIRDASSEQIIKLVEQGQIDVGIASPSAGSTALRYRPLLRDPLGVVCARGHPLAMLKRPLAWSDLRAHRFIANGTCRLIGAPPFQALLENSEMEVQNTTSLLALVAAGFGVTTLPRLAVPAGRDDVTFLSTRYDHLMRRIDIVTSSGRSLSPAAAAFVDTLEKAFHETVAGSG